MPTTVTVLPQTQRQGTDTSGTAPVPAGTTELTGGLTMATADQTNPANSVTWTAQVSPDGGTTWRDVYGPEYWVGGTIVDKHSGQTIPSPATVTIGVDPAWWGMPARMVVTAPTRFRYGAQLTVFP